MDFVRVILFGMNFGIIEINLSEGVFVLDIYIWIPTPYFLRGGSTERFDEIHTFLVAGATR